MLVLVLPNILAFSCLLCSSNWDRAFLANVLRAYTAFFIITGILASNLASSATCSKNSEKQNNVNLIQAQKY
jgi:hypothetical protein